MRKGPSQLSPQPHESSGARLDLAPTPTDWHELPEPRQQLNRDEGHDRTSPMGSWSAGNGSQERRRRISHVQKPGPGAAGHGESADIDGAGRESPVVSSLLQGIASGP